jgi:hypothetical protein
MPTQPGFEMNVLGEWVPAPDRPAADGTGLPSWFDHEEREPRVVGTLIALAAIASLLGGLVWYALVLEANEGGGAEAGGLVLVAALLWVLYLSLPTEQHHRALLRRHERFSDRMDRFVNPLRAGTERRLTLRRERDRFRAMRDERSRRVGELGEAAYRAFRQGALDPSLAPSAQRVMAIEQQMLMQDQRLQGLREPNSESGQTSSPSGTDRPPEG